MNLAKFKAMLQARLEPDYDAYALMQLGQFSLGYIPWTMSAMRPAGLRLAVNEVLIHQRRSGIEFGAGISTLFLARAFQQTGGRLTVIEHDRQWLEKISSELTRCKIPPESYSLVHAPLVATEAPGAGSWYDRNVLEGVGAAACDFALVDGPISTLGNEAVREPAGEFLRNRFGRSFALLVDDIDRPKDLQLAKKWAHLLGGRITVYRAQGAVAVIRPMNEAAYNIC